MSHQVALSFEDGVTRFITCAEDQTVADASYRSRINIPLDCRDGACGTCKAFCESGEYDGGTYIDDALTADEAGQGYVLPCSMKPRSDLVLQIASTSAVAKTQAASYTGTLTALERLSPTTVSLGVEIEARESLAFLPGQYVNIGVPGTEESRSYSFSNAPDDKELTFLVKLTPGGVMSQYLTDRAAVGDELTLTGPKGSFFLRETGRPVLLLAGGTGLAPILSILRKLRGEGSTRPVHLVYGVSTDDDLVEMDTLRELAASIDSFTWDHCVADPDSSAPNKGYVTGLIGPEHLHGGDVAVYLCGPPPMVEAVRKHFADEGVEPTGFYYEKFALTGGSPADGSAADAPSPTEPAPTEPAAAAVPEPAAATVPAPADEPVVVAAEVEPHATGEQDTVGDRGAADGPVAANDPGTVAARPAAGAATRPAARSDDALLVLTGEGREVAGQVVLPAGEREPFAGGAPSWDERQTARTVAGQQVWPASPEEARDELQAGDEVTVTGEARSVAGQEVLPRTEIEPLTPPAVTTVAADAGTPAPPVVPDQPSAPGQAIGPGQYEIGEEHPSVHQSDAIFEARQALELGAVELTIGRLSSQQLAGYRLLAESTVPHVDGDRFVDAAAYTETNAAFHDYLFTLTGNEHLLQAYQALGVKGHMEEVLRNARWCHPRCAQDHLDIVAAFESGDRAAARTLVAEHAERSKITMRRAMNDARAASLPGFVSPGRFDGKVVLVTGAAQGIGERVARRVCVEGGAVVLADRAELVRELADELTGAGYDAGAVTADLETWDGAEQVVRAALDRWGRIDVAVHTVGGTIWAKPFEHYPPEQIQAEINRSLFPTLWSCRAVLPSMIAQGHGTIVNVSSVATRGVNRVPYAAAKGGVNAITTALALEAAPHGVRVVATAPGGTDAPPRRIPRGPAPGSDQEQTWYQSIVDQTVGSSLMKRYGTLDEQAAAITFLASDEASYITGTILPVAGGDLG
ncbi:MAG TPA: benzoate 1,2-dioxygenase electron transfer component BenC [Nocardioidaceae bacterium]|nr:benzoate 1,2-dioxygenase electron transfer component BenC [Nocardioidaceae bacterium]